MTDWHSSVLLENRAGAPQGINPCTFFGANGEKVKKRESFKASRHDMSMSYKYLAVAFLTSVHGRRRRSLQDPVGPWPPVSGTRSAFSQQVRRSSAGRRTGISQERRPAIRANSGWVGGGEGEDEGMMSWVAEESNAMEWGRGMRWWQQSNKPSVGPTLTHGPTNVGSGAQGSFSWPPPADEQGLFVTDNYHDNSVENFTGKQLGFRTRAVQMQDR